MYPSRAQLVAASTVSALTASSETDQDAFYATAVAAVERFCGQSFTEQPGTRVVDGDGGSRLSLDRRLASVSAVAAESSSLDATDVTISEAGDELYIAAGVMGGGNWVEKRMRDIPGLRFPYGNGTVSITGIWGWLDTEVPDDVAHPVHIAIRLDMEDQALAKAHGLAETVRAAARLGLENIEQGSLDATVAHNDVPLSTECQNLLADFIWQPAAVRA